MHFLLIMLQIIYKIQYRQNNKQLKLYEINKLLKRLDFIRRQVEANNQTSQKKRINKNFKGSNHKFIIRRTPVRLCIIFIQLKKQIEFRKQEGIYIKALKPIIFSASFQILPEIQIHQCEGESVDLYLSKIGVSKQKNQVVSFYCNNRQGEMYPIIFQSKTVRTRFHVGVLMFQLYQKHIDTFQKYLQVKNLHTKINMKLLESVAYSIATQDFIIDPQILSVVQLQHFQISIIKEGIQRVALKASQLKGNLNDKEQSKLSLFSLRLRFKIVDVLSLNYFYDIIPQVILKRNVIEFDLNGCGVTDKLLPSILLKRENKINIDPQIKIQNLSFQNLLRLDLGHNNLTDFCFLTLGQVVATTPRLSDLCLNNNKIKLQTISSLKKQNVTIPKIPSRSSLLSPQAQTTSASNAQQPFFIQFLLSLRFLPLNYLNLDGNQIQQTQILVEYIIEGLNVPLRYLSIKDNKINEVDKIRMAKLIISEVTQRGNNEYLPVIDFGYICVIDQEIYRYIVLLKEKTDQLHLQNVTQARKSNQQFIQTRQSTKRISSISFFDLKKSEKNQPSIINVGITSNKEWQICDQGGILQVSNLYRNRIKTTSKRKSQIVPGIIMGNNTLTPSNSQSSLKVDSKNFEQVILNSQTLKPAVKMLRQAYISSNYSAIQYYKEQLIQYNQDLYNKKIAPLFYNYEKIIKKEKMKIISQLQEFINFSATNKRKNSILLSSIHIQSLIVNSHSQQNINDKLNSLISKFFRKRINYHFNQEIILYQGQLDEQIMPGKDRCWNVFIFLLFLKIKRDQLIQRYVAQNYNPYTQIHQKLKFQKNLFKNYYKVLNDWVCEDNYFSKLLQIVKQDNEQDEQKFMKRKQQQRKQMQENIKANKWGEKNQNQLIKHKYLQKCKYNVQSQIINRNNKQALGELPINKQQQFLCSVEPKLQFTGFLIKYYNSVSENNRISMIPKLVCNLTINCPTLCQPISNNIRNFLQYTSKYDLLTSSSLAKCTCINPNISLDVLPTYQDIKLAIYNGYYQESLKKFTTLVIGFLKFLYHSPYSVLPETLQYLNYLINIILSQKDRYNVQSLSTEFYLQLLTFNVSLDPQIRAAQIHPKILATLIQFCSMYLVHAQNLQPYITSHILKMQIITSNSAIKNSMCRMVRHNIQRYNKPEDQLPPDIVSFIFNNIAAQDKYLLGMPVDIHYYRRDDNYQLQQKKLQKITLIMHLLSSVPEIMNQIQSTGICKDFQLLKSKQELNQQVDKDKKVQDIKKYIRCNTNWSLFLYNNQSQKISMFLPNSRQILNLYSLYKKQIITLPTKTSKYLLLVKQLISPLQYPLFKAYNYQQEERFQNKKLKWGETIKEVQNWYMRIYRGFRDYGGCLTMMQVNQKNVYLVDIIVICVLCYIMIKHYNKLIQMVSLNLRKQKQFLTAFCKANLQDLQQFCPKGASYSLSNQQKTHVYQQCLRQLTQILTEVTIQPEENQLERYNQFLFKNMGKFHQDCKFITDCTVIADPYGHQELLFNSYGLVWVDRIIYVEAVLWRFVFNITLLVQKVGQQNQIKSIIIQWSAKQRQNERYSENVKRKNKTKELRINNISKSKDSAIFMNSCLVMMKNIGLRYIKYDNSTLYRLISNSTLLENRQSLSEYVMGDQQQLNKEIFMNQKRVQQKNNIFSIWEEIMSTIYYKQIRKNVDEENKQEESQVYQNNNTTSYNNDQNDDESRNRFFKNKVTNYLTAYLQTKRSELKDVSDQSPAYEQKQRKVSDNISNYQVERISQNSNIQVQVPSSSVISEKSQQLEPEKNTEEIIVTNARKSGKRELPKRRSSRDK